MAYDEAKAKAMRGDPEPDAGDPNVAEEKSEGEPSEARIEAAKRFCAAVESKSYRAMLAAFDDMDDDEE